MFVHFLLSIFLLINIIKQIKMNFIVNWNMVVTVVFVFIGSVQSVLNDINSTHTTNVVTNSTASGDGVTYPKILSRRRRYVAFPEGSSFSVCMRCL